MAVDTDIQSGLQFQLAFSEESVFGTPITATTSGIWKKLHLVGTPQEWDTSGLVRDFTMRAAGSRMPQNTDYYITRAGGEIVIPFTAIATDITLDFMLYAVMQDLVSEGAGAPYAKIFEWDNSTTQPDFGASAGKFFTVVLSNPISGEDMIATSCIIRDLTLSSDQATNGGRLTMTGNFVSGLTSATKYQPSGTQSLGTATEPGTTYYNHCNLVTKTISGSDMILDSWAATFNNKAVRKGCDSSGDAQTYGLGLDGYELTGNMLVNYDDNSKPFLTNSLTNGFDTQMILAWGSGNDPVDTDGDLLFKFNSTFSQTSPTRAFDNAEGVPLDVAFSGAGDGTNENVEAEIANNVDRTW